MGNPYTLFKGIIDRIGLPPMPTDNNPDYDMKGFLAKYGSADTSNGKHLTDEFKLPEHITFSQGSTYSSPILEGGIWESGGKDLWNFTPSKYNLKNTSADKYKEYFKNYERKGTYVTLPNRKPIQGTK